MYPDIQPYRGPTMGEILERPEYFLNKYPNPHCELPMREIREFERRKSQVSNPGLFAGPTPFPPDHKYLVRQRNTARTISQKMYEKGGITLTTPPFGVPTAEDQLVNKYVAAGLSKEAVPLAVRAYGDNAAKVQEFAEKFTRLREAVPDSPVIVAEALIAFDMDMDKALVALPLVRNIGPPGKSSSCDL